MIISASSYHLLRGNGGISFVWTVLNQQAYRLSMDNREDTPKGSQVVITMNTEGIDTSGQ
jgi:hypothetical protein